MTAPGSRDEIGRFLTVADAAELLAVDVATVDELIRSGELPAIRVGTTGPWRVERTQLEVWIEEQYEATRRHSLWNQGEYANVVELSGARSGRLRRSTELPALRERRRAGSAPAARCGCPGPPGLGAPFRARAWRQVEVVPATRSIVPCTRRRRW
jgi:excisionase family DNA binding protein